jgi:hypothetical protein
VLPCGTGGRERRGKKVKKGGREQKGEREKERAGKNQRAVGMLEELGESDGVIQCMAK